MKRLIAGDLMTQIPITISPETDLSTCVKLMVKKRVGSLLLVDKKKLKGIITDHDILWAIVKKSTSELKNIRAIDVAPKKIATTRTDASIEEILRKMKRLKFERLPVIQDGNLVGLITARDILNFNPEFYHEFNELSEIREQSRKIKQVERAQRTFNEGICEECGGQDFLYRFNGMLVCEECRDLT